MINITDKRNCCGCTACANICAHGAISMESDALGFYYPVVSINKCVDCGLCEKICQFKENYNRYQNFEKPKIYGCRHKDINELDKSQSGAASWGLIQAFLLDKGVVYGVAFETVKHIVHKRAKTIEECEAFRGSKYVQSDLCGVFSSVLIDLQDDKRVLFFGTGCQIAGLKSFIPQSLQKNLFTVDIVCHATPSPEFWRQYIEYFEKKRNSIVVSASFRNKRFGWHSHIETFRFADGKEVIGKNVLQRFFYDHLIVRQSCSNCHFTNMRRVSDITISDFWGWEKYYSEWNDNKGVSLLMVNSEKGIDFFSKAKSFLDYIESDSSKCLQPQLIKPIELGDKAEQVEQTFKRYGFKGVMKMYGYIGYKHQINRIKYVFKHIKLKVLQNK